MEFFLEQLQTNLKLYSKNIAFHIEGVSYTYAELERKIAAIQKKILEINDQQYFGVITRNSLETYATIFALWFSGKTSVPLGDKSPKDRNQNIIDQVNILTVFDSSDNPESFEGVTTLSPSRFVPVEVGVILTETPPDTDLYLLFTSGSTGIPKGVRISRKNLNSHLEAFSNCGHQLDSSDKCLDIYEITFDASVQCYTFPLLRGASVYTLPEGEIKFLSIPKVLRQHEITFVKMTPSVIYYLQAYFNKINLPKLRYCLFGAEALPVELVKKWEKCIPNAEIHNVYGPTEATVNCTSYKWKRNSENKSRNGITSIGKPYLKMKAIVCDNELNEVPTGVSGELCLAGPQVTKGYWKNPGNDANVFFFREIENKQYRFYRTGDLVMKDEDDDIMFIGRLDSQVQVDGYRVELGEIEYHANRFTGTKCVALAVTANEYMVTIALFVESVKNNTDEVLGYLRNHIPAYMIPGKVIFMEQIPLLSSGKTDRKKLLTMV